MRGSSSLRFRRFLTVASVLAVAALGGFGVVSDAAGSGEDPPASTAGEAQPEFVTLLRGNNLDFVPQGSPEELARTADLTVVGTIEEISEGRAFGATADSGPIWFHIILTIEVDQVLAGDTSALVDGQIYVEIPRTESQTVDTYRRSVELGQPLALFLDDATDLRMGDDDAPITPAPDIPRDARIFAPYAEGLILESETTGELIGGFVDLNDLEASWQGIDDLNGLVATIEVEPAPPFTGDVPDTAVVVTSSIASETQLTYSEAHSHEVVQGESLASIAARYDVAIVDICAENGWSDCEGHVIVPGDVVSIPAGSAIPVDDSGIPLCPDDVVRATYVVRSGDTPISVADAVATPVEELAEVNRDNPDYATFVVGATIWLPCEP